MTRRHRRDANHGTLVRELREVGFSVADTSQVGDNFPDLVIGKDGMDAKVEIKSPEGRKTAAERLSDGQKDFASTWKGSPVIVAYTLEDVLWKWNLLSKRRGFVK